MTNSPVLGVLLAGGRSRRMGGGDKCLKQLGDRPLLAHVIERAAPQVDRLILNANGDPGRFSAFGLTVVPDAIDGYAGPLAGILAAMDWAATHLPDTKFLISIATDTPFFPNDLVQSFKKRIEQGMRPLCARTEGQNHPVFGLWPTALRDDLRRAVVDEGVRKVDLWTIRHGLVAVDFPSDPFDPFFNLNRPLDFAMAERIVG